MQKYIRSSSKEVKTLGEFKSYVTDPIGNYLIGLFNNQTENLFISYSEISSRFPEDFHLFHAFETADFEKKLNFKVQIPSVIVYYHDAVLSTKESNYRVFNKVNLFKLKKKTVLKYFFWF